MARATRFWILPAGALGVLCAIAAVSWWVFSASAPRSGEPSSSASDAPVDGVRAQDRGVSSAQSSGAAPNPATTEPELPQAEPALSRSEIEASTASVAAALASFSGEVVDPYGQPIAGATVCFARPNELEAQRRFAKLLGNAQTDIRRPAADDRGAFAFTELAPGTCLLEASAPGWAASARSEIVLAPSEHVTGWRVVLRHAARIRGRALDDHGAADAGREVVLLREPTCTSPASSSAVSDAEGRFEFVDLPPGRFELRRTERRDELDSRGSASDRERSLARLRQPTALDLTEGALVDVTLGGPLGVGIRLWGNIAGHGRVAAPMFVNVTRFVRPGGSNASSMRRMFSNVDENGRYEMTLDEPGEHTLSVESQLGTLLAQQVTIAPVATQRVDLELGGGAIAGHALGANGAPIEDVEISLSQHVASALARQALGASPRAHTLTRRGDCSAQGAFEFELLPAGEYELVARAPRERKGGAAEVTSVRVAGVQLAAGQRIENLALTFELAATIEVEVLGATGEPEHLSVQVADADGLEPEIRAPRATDAQGRTRVEGLPPGSWFVYAAGERLTSGWSGPIHVAAGAVASVQVEVAPGALLPVRVERPREPGAWLVALDQRGFELARVWARAPRMQGATDDELVKLGPLPFGRIQLLAELEHGRSRVLELTLDSALPAEVVIDLGE